VDFPTDNFSTVNINHHVQTEKTSDNGGLKKSKVSRPSESHL
jgi:hypothetical protein